jgi:hypothetical protein
MLKVGVYLWLILLLLFRMLAIFLFNIDMPTINYCCLCWTNLGITEPNWLGNTSYSGESEYHFNETKLK